MTHALNNKSWLVQLIVALLIFALGLWLGFLLGHRMPQRRFPLRTAAGNSQGLQTITIKNGSGTTTLNRDAGTINKIQNNIITITDNSNGQQQVISGNNTIIMGELKEVSLADLKVGQRISVDGTLNQSNQLEARTIVIR